MLVETLIPTNIFLKSIDLKCTFRLALHGGKFGSYSNEKYYQEEETLKIFAYT